MTFEELLGSREWKPIHFCPGRYILAGGEQAVTPGDLLGYEAPVKEYDLPAVHDPVLVIPIENGGIISYRKVSGLYIHTLCDSDGFERKLKELGIFHRSC